MNSHEHTPVHIHTTYIHVLMHTPKHTQYIHVHVHHTGTCTLHTCTHSSIHTYTYTHIYAYTNIYTYVYSLPNTLIHTYTHAPTSTQLNSRAQHTPFITPHTLKYILHTYYI